MKTIKIASGVKIQRKGSKVIWTMIRGRTAGDDTTPFNYEETEVHISCIAKRNGEMWKWISLESLNKNWREI